MLLLPRKSIYPLLFLETLKQCDRNVLDMVSVKLALLWGIGQNHKRLGVSGSLSVYTSGGDHHIIFHDRGMLFFIFYIKVIIFYSIQNSTVHFFLFNLRSLDTFLFTHRLATHYIPALGLLDAHLIMTLSDSIFTLSAAAFTRDAEVLFCE